MGFIDMALKFIACHDLFRTQRENHQHHVHDVPGIGHFPIRSNVVSGAVLELVRRRRRATKPAAIVSGSRCIDDSLGSNAINDANLAVAVASGSRLIWQPPAKGLLPVVPVWKRR